MLVAPRSETERVALIVKSAARRTALAAPLPMAITGAEVWNRHIEGWRERGVLGLPYSRRKRIAATPNKRRKLDGKLGELRRAKLPPKVESGHQLIKSAEDVWQVRGIIAKAVEMWAMGMSSGAVRQAHCSRIAWVRQCKKNGHLWHRLFRCGLRFCPLCMSSTYESLFQDAFQRLSSVADSLVPEWPVIGHRPMRVIAKLDFTIRNTGEMPGEEKVRWFNSSIRRFFVRLARRYSWKKGTWGAAWCAEFGAGNTNLHAHAVFCGPWIDQKQREASALWSEVLGEYAILSVKVAKSFHHALRHAIKYPAASWKYFSASPERLATLERAFYTVRRFHVVGAFYNPPSDGSVPPTIIAPYDKCPDCGSPLVELSSPRWFSLHEILWLGSRDWGAWEREQRLLGRGAGVDALGPP